MIWDSLLLILRCYYKMVDMTNTEYCSGRMYRESLFPNLLMACVMSECRDVDVVGRPILVAKHDVMVADDSLTGHRQTFVMRWNPDISSYKVADFEHAMEDFHNDGFYYDWSVFDYEKVHVGDRFFMLKVGNGNTGIVMSGVIAGLPYKDEDWSGKGRDVRYVRMMPDCMVHPDRSIMVTTLVLDDAIPGVNWNDGHSGVLLSEEHAAKFNEIWRNFMMSQNIC